MRGLPPPSDDDKTQALRDAPLQPESETEDDTIEEKKAPGGSEGEDEDAAEGDPDDPSFDVYQFDFTTAGPNNSNSDSVPEEDSVSAEQIEHSCGGGMVLHQVE